MNTQPGGIKKAPEPGFSIWHRLILAPSDE
jgi:hypothetical protein